MRKIILSSLLSLLLSLLTGCSYVLVHSDILKDNPNQPLIDSYTGLIKKPIIELKEPCRVKYRFDSRPIVTGQIPEAREYPVAIDSGSPGFIEVSDIFVRENNLPIYPVGKTASWGFCRLPSLKIGKATIRNPRCTYRAQHWELRVLGIPITKDKLVIVGLRLMKRFRYILLDGLRKEVELSAQQSFTPAEPNNWSQYPCTIEKDPKTILMVDIPIEGEDVHIEFDTGCAYGLTVSSKLWAKLSERVKVKDSKNSKKGSYFSGWIPCQKKLIPRLTVGNKVINNAEVLVLPEDSHHISHLGMNFFKNTVVVLDFERNLMWVKNNGAD